MTAQEKRKPPSLVRQILPNLVANFKNHSLERGKKILKKISVK